jgi:hypothetical protein
MASQDTQVADSRRRAKPAVRRADGGSAAVAARTAPEAAAATPYVEPEQRRAMIAEAAYYRAERRGFEPGRELEDCYLAEGEIDGMLTRQDTPEVCGVPDPS